MKIKQIKALTHFKNCNENFRIIGILKKEMIQ